MVSYGDSGLRLRNQSVLAGYKGILPDPRSLELSTIHPSRTACAIRDQGIREIYSIQSIPSPVASKAGLPQPPPLPEAECPKRRERCMQVSSKGESTAQALS
jgi:hypothetical protein